MPSRMSPSILWICCCAELPEPPPKKTFKTGKLNHLNELHISAIFKNPLELENCFSVDLHTFLLQLLAVAIMKPRHLELRTLETHSPIEVHEAQSGAHVEDIREGFKK